jgi:hypothetical protein
MSDGVNVPSRCPARAEQGASVTQRLTRLVEMTDNIQRGPQAVRVNRRDRLADHTAIQSVRLAKISRRAGRTRRSFGRSAAALDRMTSLSDAICTVTLYS